MENGSSGGPPMGRGGFRGRGGAFGMRNKIIYAIFMLNIWRYN